MRQKLAPGYWSIIFTVALAQPVAAVSGDSSQKREDSYPRRPIRLIVALPAGGPTDLIARTVAPGFGKALGQQIVIDNRPGSGGLVGADTVAKATPDGYTLLFGAVSYTAIFPAIYPKLPYDPLRDFAPISLVTKIPNVLVINPAKLPAKDVKEFIALAKAAPGRFSYGTSGAGTSLHLAMEMLKKQTGIDVVHVPYKGGGPAATADLVAGEIQVMFDNVSLAQINNIRSGRVRALGVTTAKRNLQLPEVPTMIEAGVPDYEVTSWYGVFAPSRVPEPLLAKLNRALVSTLNSQEVSELMMKQGAEPSPTTREELAAFQKAEVAKWGKVVKDAGIKLD